MQCYEKPPIFGKMSKDTESKAKMLYFIFLDKIVDGNKGDYDAARSLFANPLALFNKILGSDDEGIYTDRANKRYNNNKNINTNKSFR